MPEVLADPDPDPDAQPRRHGAQHVAGREEAPFVEEAVRRQEHLAVDVAELSVLEEGGRDEQAVVCRFLDERDDRGQTGRGGGESSQPRIVQPHRHLAREVLELIAGEAELREDHQVRTGRPGLVEEGMVTVEIRLEIAQARRDLGEGDGERWLHGGSIRAASGGVTRALAGARLREPRAS